jgi:hypothetical protein
MSLDLINSNAFVRKTDETLRITLQNEDGSNFIAGNYVCYLTVRKNIPSTSIEDDEDSNVIIKKTIAVTLASPALTITADFSLSQTDLDIDPKNYFYDVKVNDSTNSTTSITNGYKIFSVVADITRRNV